MLRSPEPRARAAAARVLCYWRDRVDEPLELFRIVANDESPRVRLEGVRGASFFKGHEAMDVAHQILKHETDYYLNYTFRETKKQHLNLTTVPGSTVKVTPLGTVSVPSTTHVQSAVNAVSAPMIPVTGHVASAAANASRAKPLRKPPGSREEAERPIHAAAASATTLATRTKVLKGDRNLGILGQLRCGLTACAPPGERIVCYSMAYGTRES